jgi:adenylyl- and sulfurtransferase ThiI
MTKDEIIEMARQVGARPSSNPDEYDVLKITYRSLEAFTKLVAAKEREACAKVVEESSLPDTYSQECLPDIANEIRARGQE